MKKWINKILDSWWIVLICLLLIFILIVSIINDSNLNRFTTDFFNYLKLIITPLGVILGLVLGYPLLRKKLVEGYVSKEFDIIHKNNRVVRRECLRLKEKYPIKYISQKLTEDYLKEALEDIKKLNELTIDANQDAYKYSILLYNTIFEFNEKVQNGTQDYLNDIYFCETLSNYIHTHINQIYKYSKSIGYIPSSYKIIEKPILTSRLKKFVTDNKFYQVDNIDNSLYHKNSSAMLVAFFYINNINLDERKKLLLECCYIAASTPSPFARILYDREIYIPLVIERDENLLFNTRLVLIYFKSNQIRDLDTNDIYHETFCLYANISNVGFVQGTITNKLNLNQYKDIYLDDNSFDFSKIEEFTKIGESINFKIETELLKKHYISNRKKLKKRILKEL